MSSPPINDASRPLDSRDPRAPLFLRKAELTQVERGQRVLLGLPYDGGIPSRPGARFGPRALREALSSFGTYDGARDLTDIVSTFDLGDLELPTMNGERAHRMVEAAARRLFKTEARPVFIGGDHGLTGSLVRGLAAANPGLTLAMVSVDAHLDVREYEDEASLSSGTPFRRALETGVLTGANLAIVGLRRFANSRYYLEWAKGQGICLFTVEDVESRGAVTVAEEALAVAVERADALYLSVDLDVVDASVAPGVSAPGVGGFSAREMISLVRTLARHPRLIAADLMELSPPYDPDGRTARLGARLLLEILACAPAPAR